MVLNGCGMQDVEKSFEAMDKFDFDLSGFNKKKDEVPFQKTR